jgi:hypothetical protein
MPLPKKKKKAAREEIEELDELEEDDDEDLDEDEDEDDEEEEAPKKKAKKRSSGFDEDDYDDDSDEDEKPRKKVKKGSSDDTDAELAQAAKLIAKADAVDYSGDSNYIRDGSFLVRIKKFIAKTGTKSGKLQLIIEMKIQKSVRTHPTIAPNHKGELVSAITDLVTPAGAQNGKRWVAQLKGVVPSELEQTEFIRLVKKFGNSEQPLVDKLYIMTARSKPQASNPKKSFTHIKFHLYTKEAWADLSTPVEAEEAEEIEELEEELEERPSKKAKKVATKPKKKHKVEDPSIEYDDEEDSDD